MQNILLSIMDLFIYWIYGMLGVSGLLIAQAIYYIIKSEQSFIDLPAKIGYALNMKECSHKWYMRDPGIQCVKCFIVWDISMEKEIEDL